MRFLRATLANPQSQCVIWPFSDAGNGYGKVWFAKRSSFAHRVICELAHGAAPTSKHYAAHNCGNGAGGCVNHQHISWKTPKENSADQKVHGTVNRGARNGSAKLSEAQARQIKNLRGSQSPTETAKSFGVSIMTIYDIQSGKRWAWLANNGDQNHA